MRKRIFLYGGVILWTLSLFIILSDRHVTDVVPALENRIVRFLVILALSIAFGRLVRVMLLRKPARLT